MKLSESLQNALLALGAAALVGALFYLYNKTEAVDLRERNNILGTLRELKDIDVRWDVDVLRARLDLDPAGAPQIDRAPAARKALQSLAAADRIVGSPALAAALPDVSKAILQKADLVGKFAEAAAAAKAGLDGLLRNSGELAATPAAPKSRGTSLDATLGRIAAVAPQYFRAPDESQQKALEAALEELQTASAALPEAAHLKAEQARNAGLVLLKSKPVELESAKQAARLTSGPRLDALTFAFNQELEETLHEKERYRVYLIAYATALLILLGYLGGNLRAANDTRSF